MYWSKPQGSRSLRRNELYIGIINESISRYGFLVTTVLYELPWPFVRVPKYTDVMRFILIFKLS